MFPINRSLITVPGGMCVGEPHEAIAHHSFNRGVDDCRRSIAHNSCQRLARRMGLGRCRTGACSRSLNRWRDSRVILRLRLWLSVLRLWLRLSRLRLWLRIRPGLCHVRLWLPGLWLWLWDRLLRRLQIRLSPRYPPPYLRLSPRCPASLALLKSRPGHHLCCDDFHSGDDGPLALVAARLANHVMMDRGNVGIAGLLRRV